MPWILVALALAAFAVAWHSTSTALLAAALVAGLLCALGAALAWLSTRSPSR